MVTTVVVLFMGSPCVMTLPTLAAGDVSPSLNVSGRYPGTVGEVQNQEMIDISDPSQLSDAEIIRALVVLNAEQRRRAVENCDPVALIEEGFAKGFTSTGMPKDPWLINGILVCPGAKLDRSAMNHRCSFARIDTTWVWEHPDLLEDVVRHLPGAQSRMQSVSLVPVGEETAVDVIEARTRNGVHELVGVRSFSVTEGDLLLVSQRSVGKVTHR